MTEKRKVSTDALETLGTIIGPEEKRDAIHLAVIPMQAKIALPPGCGLDSKGNPQDKHHPTCVGIVDPFLKEHVNPGEWFWFVLYPRQITSLRHVWTHPAFPEEHVLNSDKFGDDELDSLKKSIGFTKEIKEIIEKNFDEINESGENPDPIVNTGHENVTDGRSSIGSGYRCEEEIDENHINHVDNIGKLQDPEESQNWIEEYASGIKKDWGEDLGVKVEKYEVIKIVRETIVFCEQEKAKIIGYCKDSGNKEIDMDSSAVIHLLNDIVLSLHKCCVDDGEIERKMGD